ncbi:MAG: tetratricopeptide repeat protein [Anaerolineales bacterium]
MTRRRRRSNPFFIFVLIVLIGASIYINEIVVPVTPPLFIFTPTPTRSPESFINEARNLFNAGNLAESIETYEQSILVDATNPSTYLELARVQIYYSEYEDALTNTENALLLNPNNSQAHALRGWALFFTDDALAATAEIKEALTLDPNNAFAHAFYAEALANEGSFEQAGEESRIAISLAPNLLEVRRARGLVLWYTGNYVEAVQEYKAALAINNNIADLHISLGQIYHRGLGEYDLARQEYSIADTLNPSNPKPDYLIARIYLKIGQYAKGIQYAEQAVQNDPDDPLLHGNLGILLYRNTQYAEAIDELRIAVQNLPLSNQQLIVDFYTLYGFALLKSNRCEEAVPVLQTLLSTVPENETAVFNANDGTRLCQELLEEPAETDTENGDNSPEPTPIP